MKCNFLYKKKICSFLPTEHFLVFELKNLELCPDPQKKPGSGFVFTKKSGSGSGLGKYESAIAIGI